jgi:hypothetical protein
MLRMVRRERWAATSGGPSHDRESRPQWPSLPPRQGRVRPRQCSDSCPYTDSPGLSRYAFSAASSTTSSAIVPPSAGRIRKEPPYCSAKVVTTLAGARMDGADLRGASLQGAGLSAARGLTREQIAGATTDAQTRLPDSGGTQP